MRSYYLVVYNLASATGWSYILILTIFHLSKSTTQPQPSTFHRILAYIKYPTHFIIPPYLQPLYNRAITTYSAVGAQTAIVQSFAALEVLHVLLKWVKSPLQTTAMQVSSRLFMIWGITEQFDAARTNPIYASMVLAWAATEVIRYSFYACNLLGYEPYPLLYLRYTTFYVLYLIGAPSEAMLIYATLPKSSPIPSLKSWVQGMWRPTDYFRAAMFAIWWPSLYVMYTHMIRQRRKVLGTAIGKTLAAKPKAH